MATRKLEKDAQALDELLAQAFDRRATIGKNVAYRREQFQRTNNTEGIALLRGLATTILAKGMHGVDGTIGVKVGPLIQGNRISSSDDRKIHEVIGRSQYSGQELVRGYHVGFEVTKRDGTVATFGYTYDTRLDHEVLIGPQHIDTLLATLPLLHDPDMRKKLRMPSRKKVRRHYARLQSTLSDLLEAIPASYAKFAERHNVDLEAIGSLDVFKVGKELAKGEWSALLWALDPAKNKNVYNWYRQRAKEHELPGDVREAWVYLTAYPYLLTREQTLLLGAYQMQARAQPRKGIAGHIPEELHWLAKDRKAERARELYRFDIDLSVPHKPARFYTGDIPLQEMSVEQKLNEKYWTVADREGILRQFPLGTFRKKWNACVLDRLYDNDVRGFDGSIKHLCEVRNADARVVARDDGSVENTQLKENYKFVNEMLSRMKDTPSSQTYRRENLLARTPVHTAGEAFERLRKVEWFLRPLDERGPKANYGRKR